MIARLVLAAGFSFAAVAVLGCHGGTHDEGTGGAGGGEGGGDTTSGTTTSSTGATTSSSTGATTSSSTSSSSGGSSLEQAREDCVAAINKDRATVGLAPYARWTANEACTDQQAQTDAAAGVGHSSLGACGELAQDECPGWPGPPDSMITMCLSGMWAEGPGNFNTGHGHYDNMSSTTYTMVSCGFYVEPNGAVWATQDFE
jgi:hypothetical protein